MAGERGFNNDSYIEMGIHYYFDVLLCIIIGVISFALIMVGEGIFPLIGFCGIVLTVSLQLAFLFRIIRDGVNAGLMLFFKDKEDFFQPISRDESIVGDLVEETLEEENMLTYCCPNCPQYLRVPDEYSGSVRCPSCKVEFFQSNFDSPLDSAKSEEQITDGIDEIDSQHTNSNSLPQKQAMSETQILQQQHELEQRLGPPLGEKIALVSSKKPAKGPPRESIKLHSSMTKREKWCSKCVKPVTRCDCE